AEVIQPLGALIADATRIAWTPPAALRPGVHRLPLPLADERSNPVPVVIANVALAGESDATNDAPSAAQPVSIPCGINGRIDREGDVDCYAFEAQKGDRFSFEVIARRVQSALDSHIRVLDEKGKQLALNDDLKLGKR